MKTLTIKAFIFYFCFIGFCCISVSAEESEAIDRPIEDKWALVIGIDKFQDKRIQQLSYSAKDARDFADFLATKGNFARDHIKLLTNEKATYQAIRESLGDTWLPKRAMSNDLVVIYVSTHGSPREMDVGKDNWLVAHNTNIDKFFTTGIQLKSLANTVKARTGCDRVVLLLDACNSGAAQTGGGKGLIRNANFDINSIVGEGELVISSSQSNQRSWESKRYKNGVFTRKLIELLSGPGANMPLEKVFTELKTVVEQEVRFDRTATQTPVLKSKWKGKPLILTAKPVRPRSLAGLEGKQASASNMTPSNTSKPIPQSSQSNQQTATQANTNTPQIAMTQPSSQVISKENNALSGKIEHRQNIGTKQLAFFGISAPKEYTILKTPTYGVVTRDDFEQISSFPANLSFAIDRDLKSRLGNKYVARASLINALKGGTGLNSSTPGIYKKIGRLTGSKYIAHIAITKFYFKGQVAWSNIYDIQSTIYIYDGTTGNRVAQFKKRYKKQPWLGDSAGSWISYVNNKIIPKLAKTLSKSIRDKL